MFFVTGATGNVGRNVVTQLLAEGVKVRAASRNPEHASLPGEVEVVRADLADVSSPQAVFQGVDGLFLFPARGPLAGFVSAAAQAGVKRIVLLSSSAVADERLKATPIGATHIAAEQAVEAAGVQWTFVRPGPFMVNDLAWAAGIKSAGIVRAPYGEAVAAHIDERDIAGVVVRALLEDGHAGNAYEVTGPQALSQVERVRVLAEVLGRPIRFEEQPVAEMREQLLRQVPEELADVMLELLRLGVEESVKVSPTGAEVLGRPLHTYEEWAVRHAGDFQ
ncbi:NAD(P)H-binding protein [Amycolatopsis sp. NPDC051371]|jgi:uncharacterized protein YbjT (DUF2867 family)|uniref:NAD(P)H-binding protein n=1 Tax=Amycolatopsis sp. NPDC051371 TaxID=3155800 RepID=UPI0034391D8A